MKLDRKSRFREEDRGMVDALNETDDATYPTLGWKPKKIWASEIFPKNLLLGADEKVYSYPCLTYIILLSKLSGVILP